MRILVIEDEPKAAAYVRKGLTEQGYAVDVAHDGIDGLHMATTNAYDIVLLDVMLPGIDGWTVLERMRRECDTPVLFLTSRGQVEDRVKGLQLGADDYLVKPFAFSELLARVQTILRRGPVRRDETLRVDDFEFDPVRRRVSRGGQRIVLTAKEYALLEYLATHPGHVFSRTMIIEHVWDHSFEGLTNIVDVYVRHLRSKVDDPFPVKLIRTVRGVGYGLAESAER